MESYARFRVFSWKPFAAFELRSVAIARVVAVLTETDPIILLSEQAPVIKRRGDGNPATSYCPVANAAVDAAAAAVANGGGGCMLLVGNKMLPVLIDAGKGRTKRLCRE